MARVNVGINPEYLADQHLIAESVEITMITGNLRKNDYKIKSLVPESFRIGTGHINFFKNKLLYLKNRLAAVNAEMENRGFNPGTHIYLGEFPYRFQNNWTPSLLDSKIVRGRIKNRLLWPKNGRPGGEYYRYYREYIGTECIEDFANRLLNSELYYL